MAEPNPTPRPLVSAANSNEWDSVPLKAYPLYRADHRRAFLFQVYWRGEECLFEAVAHIWSSLKSPKDYSAAGILNAAGIAGSSKSALMRMLKVFIHEGLGVIAPIPSPASFPSLEAWNEMIKQDSDREQLELDRILDKWTSVLNGEKASPSGGH